MANNGGVTLHKRIESALLNSDKTLCRERFKKNLIATLGDSTLGEDLQAFFNCIPDLFKIDDTLRIVIAVEIECTNPIRPHRMEQYKRLWWFLDNEGWEFRLFIYNRFGVPCEIDLLSIDVMSWQENQDKTGAEKRDLIDLIKKDMGLGNLVKVELPSVEYVMARE